jgi:hypothetical protein
VALAREFALDLLAAVAYFLTVLFTAFARLLGLITDFVFLAACNASAILFPSA